MIMIKKLLDKGNIRGGFALAGLLLDLEADL